MPNINELEKYKARVERRIESCTARVQRYEGREEYLSSHGHWSAGYFSGVLNTLENLLDDIEDALQEARELIR